MRVRGTRIVSGQIRCARYWEGEPREESRQEYANHRLAEFQRVFPDEDFAFLLGVFRSYGDLYDQGYRLRDGMEGAA